MQKWSQSVWYWKLAVWKAGNSTLIVGLMTYLAATATSGWGEMSYDAKVEVVGCTLVSMLKNVDAFLDSTISSLKSQSDTAFFTKHTVPPASA